MNNNIKLPIDTDDEYRNISNSIINGLFENFDTISQSKRYDEIEKAPVLVALSKEIAELVSLLQERQGEKEESRKSAERIIERWLLTPEKSSHCKQKIQLSHRKKPYNH